MSSTFNSTTSGVLYALLAALMWGVLPIFIKLLLIDTDAYTITAVRFIFAAVVVFVIVFSKSMMPRLRGQGNLIWPLLVVGTLFLLINYVTNVIALDYISPSTVQLVMQLAPFLLLLGGVLIYGEHFSKLQIFGAVVLVSGMLMFFNQRIPVIMSSQTESIEGVFIVVISALAWAVYALTQKRLLAAFTSQQLTLLIYVLGGACLIPFAAFADLIAFSKVQWFAMFFCCINTLIAYGAFTHAMQIWDASKVSAVISITPVFTYLSNKLAVIIAPELFYDEQMNVMAYIGASCVIIGAILASIGKLPVRARRVKKDQIKAR